MGRHKTKNTEIKEPKNTKWFKIKIIFSNGDGNTLIEKLSEIKPKSMIFENAKFDNNTFSAKIKSSIPNMFMLLLKSAKFATPKGIKFTAVFIDFEKSLNWCGYYESTSLGTIEGSRFTNRTKLNAMIENYFKN